MGPSLSAGLNVLADWAIIFRQRRDYLMLLCGSISSILSTLIGIQFLEFLEIQFHSNRQTLLDYLTSFYKIISLLAFLYTI